MICIKHLTTEQVFFTRKHNIHEGCHISTRERLWVVHTYLSQSMTSLENNFGIVFYREQWISVGRNDGERVVTEVPCWDDPSATFLLPLPPRPPFFSVSSFKSKQTRIRFPNTCSFLIWFSDLVSMKRGSQIWVFCSRKGHFRGESSASLRWCSQFQRRKCRPNMQLQTSIQFLLNGNEGAMIHECLHFHLLGMEENPM